MAAEAELWLQAGDARKAQEVGLDAYRLGSLKVEALLKRLYVARTGGDAGFGDDLIVRLRGRGGAAATALRPTPAFSTTTLDGARIDAASFQGRTTVLDFWFINCPPCRVERPLLNDLVAEFGDKVRYVGFSTDPADRLRQYVRETPFKFEVVPDSDGIARAFGVSAFPTYMIVNPAGSIVWISGNGDDRVERLRAMIVRVLAATR
jgi:peroxiredoxin